MVEATQITLKQPDLPNLGNRIGKRFLEGAVVLLFLGGHKLVEKFREETLMNQALGIDYVMALHSEVVIVLTKLRGLSRCETLSLLSLICPSVGIVAHEVIFFVVKSQASLIDVMSEHHNQQAELFVDLNQDLPLACLVWRGQ